MKGDFKWNICVLCSLPAAFCSSGVDELGDYDPNLLSDPQWPCGKHKRVLIFASYVVSLSLPPPDIITY